MEIKRYEDMDLQALDVMREIGSIGTSHAATALSKLLQKEVRISIPSVNILGYNDAMNRIGDAEELVAAALVKMSGDIEGLMLFLFDLDFANEVLEKFLGNRYESFLDMNGQISTGRSRKHHYLFLYKCFFTTCKCRGGTVCSKCYHQHAGWNLNGTYC